MSNDTLTMEMIKEAMALIKALAPKSAPNDLYMIRGITSLRIIKNEMLPTNTIVVSKDLFDMIYEASNNGQV